MATPRSTPVNYDAESPTIRTCSVRRRWLTPLFVFALLLPNGLTVRHASAIKINVVYKDANSTEPTATDPDGAHLTRIVREAADRWEKIIQDDYEMTLNIWYDPQSTFSRTGTLAVAPIVTANAADNRTLVGNIRFNNAAEWYFDERADTDFEFAMGQTLLRNLEEEQDAIFNVRTAFQELEEGFSGEALSTASLEARNNVDLLTVALHEIGHHLGVTNQHSGATGEWQPDNDYDLPTNLERNRLIAVRTNDGFGHLSGAGDASNLMQPFIDDGLRRLPSATDVLAAAAASNWTQIDLPRQDFIAAGSGNDWTDFNWIGGQVPDRDDDAFIRSQDFDPTVELVSAAEARNLFVGDGDNLSTNAHKLDVGGRVTIDGLRTDVSVDAGGELEANQVLVQNGAALVTRGGLIDSQVLVIDDESLVIGHGGTVGVSGSLSNSGAIHAATGTVIVGGLADSWDPDGNESGTLSAGTGDLVLMFTNPPTDDFNGTMVVGAGGGLGSSHPFVIGSGAEIRLNGGTTSDQRAHLNVRMNVEHSSASIDASGKVYMQAPFDMTAGQFDLAANADVEMAGATSISGGNFQVASGGKLRFEEETQLSGGAFSTTGNGRVELNGPTEYRGGNITVDGRVRQDGDATVSNPTRISGSGTWDLDGNSGDTVWNVNDDLTLDVARIDDSAHQFDGTLNVNGGATTLAVNTSTPWEMAGRLRLDGGSQLEGSSQVNVTGTLSVRGGSGTIGAPLAFKPGATVSVSAGRTLRLEGTTYYDGGTFSGGTIQQHGPAHVRQSTTIGQNFAITQTIGAPPTPLWLEQFDWDGTAGSSALTNIASGKTLTINAVRIDGEPEADGYDGTVNVNGGMLLVNTGVRVPIILPPNIPAGVMIPATTFAMPWRLDGTMNLRESGGNPAVVTSHFGSGMLVHGEVNATDGRAAFGVPVSLKAGGRINVHDSAVLTAGLGAGAGTVDVATGGLLRLNSSSFGPDAHMSIDGAAELLSRTTFHGGVYDGTGTIHQMGSATVAETTSFGMSVDFADGGTNTIETGKELQLGFEGRIAAGAVFAGEGTVRNLDTSTLTLADRASVDVGIVNEGTLALGSRLGSVDALQLTQTSASTLAIDLAGTALGEFDQLFLSDEAQLAGQLAVSLWDGFQPVLGDSFSILTARDGVSGAFDSLDLPLLGRGLTWSVDYDPTAVLLEVLEGILGGDLNGDGYINFGDLAPMTLALNDPATYAAMFPELNRVAHCDVNADGACNFGDLAPFTALLTGGPAASASASAVPEPNAGVLALIAFGIIAGTVRQSASPQARHWFAAKPNV